jgi:hypothetical protein
MKKIKVRRSRDTLPRYELTDRAPTAAERKNLALEAVRVAHAFAMLTDVMRSEAYMCPVPRGDGTEAHVLVLHNRPALAAKVRALIESEMGAARSPMDDASERQEGAATLTTTTTTSQPVGPIHVVRCSVCDAAGSLMPDGTKCIHVGADGFLHATKPIPADAVMCRGCLGRGVRWNDGRPMTLCPGGGPDEQAPLHGKPDADLPCGRGGATCPGCGRPATEIGLDDDVKRTIDAREGKR